MAAATVIFILYVVSAGNLPDLTALASFDSKQACLAAAEEVGKALDAGQDGKMPVCLGSDALGRLASQGGAGE